MLPKTIELAEFETETEDYYKNILQVILVNIYK